jgi:hypothetical protein
LSIPLDATAELTEESDLGEQVDASDLWEHIRHLLPDERDRILARCTFVLGMKPRQIRALYADRWSTEREVSVALYRIRHTLRSDSILAVLAGTLAVQARHSG